MSAKLVPARPSRRWGPGTAAIARLLIATREPLTQVAIAEAVGVTQPRASQVLKQLDEHATIRSSPRGYVATKRARLLELYLERSQPVLTRPEEPWYGTAELFVQVRAALDLARATAQLVAVSADVGPDLLVPWRHPTIAIIYTQRTLELGRAHLVRAEGRADASILVRTTKDASLLQAFSPWPAAVEDIPLTDPVQQWRDLLDLGGDDRREAADRLRHAILDHSIRSAT